MKKILFSILLFPSICFATGSRTLPSRAAANISMGNVYDIAGTKLLTVSIWIKTTETATEDFIIGKRNDVFVADVGYSIAQDASDSVYSQISDGTFKETCQSKIDSDGLWYNYTIRMNSSRSTLFENAVDLCPGLGSFVGVISSTSNFKIGNSDSTRIPSSALAANGYASGSSYTEDQIREAMYMPESIFAGKPRSWWPLWMTQTTPEKDYSDQGFNGTVSGGAFFLPSTDGPPVMYGGLQ